MRESKMREFFDAETDIRKLGVIACPTFRLSENNCAQNFAALQLRWLRLLLCRFGTERALGLRRIGLRCHGSERAMIRDREPGTDRNQDDRAARARFHRELQSLTTGKSQTFSSAGSTAGATSPGEIPPGGTVSPGSTGFSLG